MFRLTHMRVSFCQPCLDLFARVRRSLGFPFWWLVQVDTIQYIFVCGASLQRGLGTGWPLWHEHPPETYPRPTTVIPVTSHLLKLLVDSLVLSAVHLHCQFAVPPGMKATIHAMKKERLELCLFGEGSVPQPCHQVLYQRLKKDLLRRMRRKHSQDPSKTSMTMS